MGKPWFVLSISTSLSIGIMNYCNIEDSPKYTNPMNSLDYLRFGICISVKSLLYGIAWPCSLAHIGLDMYQPFDRFSRHFVPFHTYPGTGPHTSPQKCTVK